MNFFVGDLGLFQDHFPMIDLTVESLVWTEFLRMFNEITSYSKLNKPTNILIEKLRDDLIDWCGLYLTLKDGKITPYVHAFVWHVPDFLEKFGD